MGRDCHRIVISAVTIASAGCLITLTTPAAPALAATFASTLTGVSCPGTNDCMAVGWSEASGQASVDYTLAETWNGSSWAIVPTPSPSDPGGGAELNAVSCTSSSDCMAVGQAEIFQAHGGALIPHPLAEMWNGTRWTLVPTPKFVHTGAKLNGVSCTPGAGGGPARCMAVGSEGGPKHPAQFTLAESWNGSSWKFVGTPMPLTPGGTALNAVSCADTAGCMAVGYYGYGGLGTSVSLAEMWNGKKWRRLVTPTPDSSATFSGVACPAATDCEAVGTHAESSPTLGAGTFAASWAGHGWKTQPSPNPGAAGGAGLAGVSCTAPAACMAAGSWVDQEGEVVSTLAEAWDGNAWNKLGTPSPRYTSPLLGIACASTPDCMAVGSTQGQTGNQVTLGEAWNGSKWTVLRTPNP